MAAELVCGRDGVPRVNMYATFFVKLAAFDKLYFTMVAEKLAIVV